MNILFVSLDNFFFGGGITKGSQIRSLFLLDAIRSANKDGKIYLLTAPESIVKCDSNVHVRYFNSKAYSYNTMSGILKKFYKTLAGMGFLPKSLVNEYNPGTYFPNVKFDCIFLRYQNSACLFPYYKLAPVILDYDDHPLQAFDNAIKSLTLAGVRPFAKVFSRIRFHIIRKHISIGFLSNENDVGLFRQHNVMCLPNVVRMPDATYNPLCRERDFLFTVGDMSYNPNYLGVDKFLNEIWPSFHKKYPDVKYLIAGRGLPESYARRWSEIDGVEYIGYVDDLDKAYERCLATVVPIWSGSGTAIKTRESLIHSRCCLSSPLGARGLENCFELKNQGLFIFDDAMEFIKTFEMVIDEKKRVSYERMSYQYAKENFSYTIFEGKVKEAIIMIGVKSNS